jgi:two-component system nitrate/nitrite response regulator NarL
MTETIRVMMLDDHQAILDGYHYRLGRTPDIQIVGSFLYGEALEAALETQPADVLILDISAPTSPNNVNPYPILYLIPKFLDRYPDLAILIISMHAERILVRELMDAGASGYILKDDRAAMLDLPGLVRLLYKGGVYTSKKINDLLRPKAGQALVELTPRQLEALSYAAAYPDASTAVLAQKLNITASTLRTLLSSAYLRLEVSTRAAALAKARQLGLLSPE